MKITLKTESKAGCMITELLGTTSETTAFLCMYCNEFILQYFDGTHGTNRPNSLLALLNQGTHLPHVEINTLAYVTNTDIRPIFPYFTDESTRLTQTERRRPTLQEVRLKNYFNSVESSSCASCEHVRIYCVQETVT